LTCTTRSSRHTTTPMAHITSQITMRDLPWPPHQKMCGGLKRSGKHTLTESKAHTYSLTYTPIPPPPSQTQTDTHRHTRTHTDHTRTVTDIHLALTHTPCSADMAPRLPARQGLQYIHRSPAPAPAPPPATALTPLHPATHQPTTITPPPPAVSTQHSHAHQGISIPLDRLGLPRTHSPQLHPRLWAGHLLHPEHL
jgi:hypothetical protein